MEPLTNRGNSSSLRHFPHPHWIFEELPTATLLSVSRPDTADISPLLLSYEIQLQYKHHTWRLHKKASQFLILHFSLRKRAFLQDHVGEWLQTLGIGEDHEGVEGDVEEPDDDMFRTRVVPSSAALALIRPSLAGQQAIAEIAKSAMQNYLTHLLGNMDIVNSPEVCSFLQVSKLSFCKEYGPKLKEGYVHVRHLPGHVACPCDFLSRFTANWRRVWAVLKPGFLVLLENPTDAEILDIIIFSVMPAEDGCKGRRMASFLKEKNAYEVCGGSRCVKFKTSSSVKVMEWVSAINDAGWGNPQRFRSFAPPRGIKEDDSHAQWFVDGKAAFQAIASAIESAKSEIFITGWWLCPELFLCRPHDKQQSSQLEELIKVKAKQGVQIYVLLYKEVSIALKINSQYSKKRLQRIHDNVKVLRYPDHLSAGVYLWSHHEKLVIVDYSVCFIGGLDLCYGRYDTSQHRVDDSDSLVWPGKDYYNPRESEPNSWDDMTKDELNRTKHPRMPWHDVHCALWGPPCRDVARHFVQRWNHAKRNKAPNEHGIPLLLPRQHMVLPHYIRSEEVGILDTNTNTDTSETNSPSTPLPIAHIPLLLPQETESDSFSFSTRDSSDESGTDEGPDESETEDGQTGPRCPCVCQIVRSVSHWSAGTSRSEDSIHRAYCSLIQNAEHFVYIENQFFISGLQGDDTIQNRVLDALYKRIMLAHEENKCFRVIVVLPLLPGFQGGVDDGGAATVRAIMHWQHRGISREKTSILHYLTLHLGEKAREYISFYGLRTYGKLCEDGPLATSQIYVHSKLMIVDDRVTVIGSSNINDRSLLGSRDSEIAAVIEDKEFVESSMNGQPWMAGKFAHSLRCNLWSEHLNLDGEEINKIVDPIGDSTYKQLWVETARENTAIYREVFGCLPDDRIRSRAALRQHVNSKKTKVGSTTIDLGIAPERIEQCEEGETKTIETLEKLKSIKGHLVSFPLKFMCQEDLRPMINEGEFYTSPHVFH